MTGPLIVDGPKLQVLWPSSPLLSNYPQLAALRSRLTELFDHKTSYVDYEDKAVPLLQDFDPQKRGQ